MSKETINENSLTEAGYTFVPSSFQDDNSIEVGVWEKEIIRGKIKFVLSVHQYLNDLADDTFDWQPHFMLKPKFWTPDSQTKTIQIDLISWLCENGKYSRLPIEAIEVACMGIAIRLEDLL